MSFKLFKYGNYTASISIDPAAGILYGKVLGIKDVVTFRGRSVREAKRDFENSVKAYTRFCTEKLRQSPDIPFSEDPSDLLQQFIKEPNEIFAQIKPFLAPDEVYLSVDLLNDFKQLLLGLDAIQRYLNHKESDCIKNLVSRLEELRKEPVSVSTFTSKRMSDRTLDVFKYENYTASITIDYDTEVLYGKVRGIQDVVTFRGQSVEEAEKDFQKSVDAYLKFCNPSQPDDNPSFDESSLSLQQQFVNEPNKVIFEVKSCLTFEGNLTGPELWNTLEKLLMGLDGMQKHLNFEKSNSSVDLIFKLETLRKAQDSINQSVFQNTLGSVFQPAKKS
jgi:predicted HicB family RNase H-like nuclease